jgi:elongation factor G
MRGKSQEATRELVAGDIGAVSKLTATGTSDTLCQKEQPLTLDPIQFPQANYAMAANPKTKSDVEKMSSALSRIVEEDPTLKAVRDPDTVEMLLWGVGESHLDVTVEKVRRKFGAELTLQTPRVPYKETITAVSKAEYRHKKQTGGHGQYGHVVLRLEPKGPGEGFEFAEEVVGGAVPKEYIPAVEKGVTKSLDKGALAGYPLVDLKVVLIDGSFHEVDSSGISFEIAASHALGKGVIDGRPVLLEPIMRITITVPDGSTGEVIGDLNQKRGRILGMTPHSGVTEIEAEVPHAEILRYATELRSLTQGRGSYKAEFLRYEEVPAHITQKVVEEAKRAAAEKA